MAPAIARPLPPCGVGDFEIWLSATNESTKPTGPKQTSDVTKPPIANPFVVGFGSKPYGIGGIWLAFGIGGIGDTEMGPVLDAAGVPHAAQNAAPFIRGAPHLEQFI
jgi:hypothetical protein